MNIGPKKWPTSIATGPWLCLGPVTVEYWPFFSELYSVTQPPSGVQYPLYVIVKMSDVSDDKCQITQTCKEYGWLRNQSQGLNLI